MIKRVPIKFQEKKTMKMCIAVRPTVHAKAMRIAHIKGNSLNNLINELLEDYIDNNAKYLDYLDYMESI